MFSLFRKVLVMFCIYLCRSTAPAMPLAVRSMIEITSLCFVKTLFSPILRSPKILFSPGIRVGVDCHTSLKPRNRTGGTFDAGCLDGKRSSVLASYTYSFLRLQRPCLNQPPNLARSLLRSCSSVTTTRCSRPSLGLS